MREHPEDFCDKCKRPNITWFADNDVWNRVVDNVGIILCPVCFVQMAEEKGVSCTSWRVSRESDGPLIDRLKMEIRDLQNKLSPEKMSLCLKEHCF